MADYLAGRLLVSGTHTLSVCLGSSPVRMKAAWLKKRLLFTLVAVGLVSLLALFLSGGSEGEVAAWRQQQQLLKGPRGSSSFDELEANISSICEFKRLEVRGAVS